MTSPVAMATLLELLAITARISVISFNSINPKPLQLFLNRILNKNFIIETLIILALSVILARSSKVLVGYTEICLQIVPLESGG